MEFCFLATGFDEGNSGLLLTEDLVLAARVARNWALDGIYAVLDRDRALPLIRHQAGRFSPQLLAALVWQKYRPADHSLFLSLMEQCQICFKAAHDVYVAPALLPSESEARVGIDQAWRGAIPDAAAQLDYSFLHEGVLRGMLCGLGKKASIKCSVLGVWNLFLRSAESVDSDYPVHVFRSYRARSRRKNYR